MKYSDFTLFLIMLDFSWFLYFIFFLSLSWLYLLDFQHVQKCHPQLIMIEYGMIEKNCAIKMKFSAHVKK